MELGYFFLAVGAVAAVIGVVNYIGYLHDKAEAAK